MYWELFFAFVKIGFFAFGGGYAMIPLIEEEILSRGWLTVKEFANIIAISQMTPGPIAVNSATFVGYRVLGVLGSAVATIGVVLPSFILTLLVFHFIMKRQDTPIIEKVFWGIRPAVVALIAAAGILLIPTSVSTGSHAALALITIAAVLGTHIHPILLILLGGVWGLLT